MATVGPYQATAASECATRTTILATSRASNRRNRPTLCGVEEVAPDLAPAAGAAGRILLRQAGFAAAERVGDIHRHGPAAEAREGDLPAVEPRFIERDQDDRPNPWSSIGPHSKSAMDHLLLWHCFALGWVTSRSSPSGHRHRHAPWAHSRPRDPLAAQVDW